MTARDGVAKLEGTVDSYTERMLAEQAALRVAGVRAVVNRLTVEVPAGRRRGDEEQARAAAQALEWNEQVPDTVRAVVLQGDVGWHFERQAAERAVRDLTGVRDVLNEIAVRPTVVAEDVRGRVRQALQRSAVLDAGRITIEEGGGRVVLRGAARSWLERDEAERVASSVAGVTAVDNRIRIWPGEPLEVPAKRIFRDVERSGVLPRGVGAADAVSAVLCPLSMRISGGEALDLLESLPPSIQTMLRPCVRHRVEQPELLGRDDLLRRVADHLVIAPADAERVIRAVCEAVRRVLPRKEASDVESQPPADIRELWRPALERAA